MTIACLASYFAQDIEPAVRLGAVLVDDGSPDGTAEAVRERFPHVEVIEGSGNLYWAGAMAVAERAAIASDPDFLLWLNDDVVLDTSALGILLETSRRSGGRSVVVGAMRDPASGALTYSGLRRTGRHPLRMALVPPRDEPVEVETFNGNVVLVSRAVRNAVGPMDGALHHSAADYDYGLRAGGRGFRNLLAPGTVGTCERDGGRTPWRDGDRSLRERLEVFFGPKGFPPAPRARYLRRHGGFAWPALWLWTYLRRLPAVIRGARSDPTRRRL
jgi:GT2 family glycosyltransferase